MRVGVGSGNPVKRRAVERATAATATVEAVRVDSGVADQPRGHAETIRGAENRAREAIAAGGFDLGIGIEGGVADLAADGWTADGSGELYLVMWAAATDGSRTARGGGPSFPLPDGVAAQVREGAELGPVMDDVLGESDVAKRQGAAGAFTNGRVDRDAALATAVAGALGPFVTDRY